MKTKVLIPTLVAGALAAALSFKYIRSEENTPTGRSARVLSLVQKAIENSHLDPRPLDDTLSARVYDKVFEQLDYSKSFFTAPELAALSKYRFQIDDQTKDNRYDFFTAFNAGFTKGINRAEGYVNALLAQPFDFNTDEDLQLNGDRIAWASSDADLKDRWRKTLKYRTLLRYEELKKDSTKKGWADAKLQDTARASILKNQQYFFKRLRNLDDNERFAIYVNAITTNIDPHTDYFPPRDKKRFDAAMAGSFIGIGASLRDDEGKIKIVSIIAGSPSWKQGDLKAGDEIMKVAQPGAEPEDIQGLDIDQVVDKIRGKEGTTVRLTIRRPDGAIKVVPIVRGKVETEETFAKSAIIKGADGNIGYIYLPEFYADFQNPNGRFSAQDVGREVIKLKSAGVKGIILDLRNNGGGSLNDVVDMAGQFIDRGPIVQVKSTDAPQLLRDNKEGTLWDGPLAIMVNQGSASASEIMAAALQDYKRAIIVGTTTFGKGTVQKVVPLERQAFNPFSNDAPEDTLGSLKVTIQKFYRINGGSTQLRGVTPDVILPDPYQYVDVGERRDIAALAWDEIPAASYKTWENGDLNIPALAAASKKRVAANGSFAIVENGAKKMKAKEDNNVVSLNGKKYLAQQAETNAESKKLEDLEKKNTGLTVSNLEVDMDRVNLDASTKKANETWIKALQKDMYINETVNIVRDMMSGGGRTGMRGDR